MEGNKKNTYKKNLAENTITQIILYFTPLLLSPYVSRVLLPEGIGEYSYANSIVYYFSVFVSFGFLSLGNRQISLYKDNKDEYSKEFWSIIFSKMINFFLVSIIYFILLCCGFFNNIGVNVKIISLLYITILSNAFDINFLFQGLCKFRIISLVQVISNIMYAICIVFFVKGTDDLYNYCFLKSFLNFFVDCIMWIISIKLLNKPSFEKEKIISIYKKSFLFFLPNLVMTITPMIDQTMLGFLASNKQVGFYEQMYKIISMLGSLSYGLTPVILSHLSYLYNEKKYDICKEKIYNAISFVSLIIVPITFGLIVISKYFVPLYFGNEFLDAVPVLIILSFSLLFSTINSILINAYYYPTMKVKLATSLMACSSTLNLIANIFAIKKFGAVGASITTTLLSFICSILYFIFSKNFISLKLVLRRNIKTMLSALIMFIIIFLLNKYFLEKTLIQNIFIIILDIILGVIFYFGFMFLFKDRFLINHVLIVFKGKRKNEKN